MLNLRLKFSLAWLFGIAFMTLAYNVVLGAFIESDFYGFFHVDSDGFIKESYVLAQKPWESIFNEWPSDKFPELVLSSVIKITGSHHYILLLNASVHFATAYFVYSLLRDQLKESSISVFITLMFAYYPIFYIWISQIHRDGFSLLGIAGFLASVTSNRLSIRAPVTYAIGSIGIALIYLNRDYLVVLVLLTALVINATQGRACVKFVIRALLCTAIGIAAGSLLQNTSSTETETETETETKNHYKDTYIYDSNENYFMNPPFTLIHNSQKTIDKSIPCAHWDQQKSLLLPKFFAQISCAILQTREGSINSGGRTLVNSPTLEFASDIITHSPTLVFRSLSTPTLDDMVNVGISKWLAILITAVHLILILIALIVTILMIKRNRAVSALLFSCIGIQCLTWIVMPNVGTYIRLVAPFKFALICAGLVGGIYAMRYFRSWRSLK